AEQLRCCAAGRAGSGSARGVSRSPDDAPRRNEPPRRSGSSASGAPRTRGALTVRGARPAEYRRDALSSPILLAIYRWNAPMSGFVRARPRSLGLHVTEPIAVGEKNVWFAVPMSGPGLTGLKLPLGAST